MTGTTEFEGIVNRAMDSTGAGVGLRPVVEKELLHYEILGAMDAGGFVDRLTFQGGTCLRLCHGSERFSEDLDFTGGVDFSVEDMASLAETISKRLEGRLGLRSAVKPPKDTSTEGGVAVRKWQVSVETAPERRRLPKQRIKIEIAALPSHTRETRGLIANYEELPSGSGDTLLHAQTLTEILADKLVALPACVSHVRHRDVWDIRWLRQRRTNVDPELVARKVADYSVVDFESKVADRIDGMEDICRSDAFHAEMRRFLPAPTYDRTLGDERFLSVLADQNREALQMLLAPENSPKV